MFVTGTLPVFRSVNVWETMKPSRTPPKSCELAVIVRLPCTPLHVRPTACCVPGVLPVLLVIKNVPGRGPVSVGLHAIIQLALAFGAIVIDTAEPTVAPVAV